MDLLSQNFHRSRWLCCLEDWPKISHVFNFSNAEWLGEGLTYCFWKDQYTPTLLGVFFNPKSYWVNKKTNYLLPPCLFHLVFFIYDVWKIHSQFKMQNITDLIKMQNFLNHMI